MLHPYLGATDGSPNHTCPAESLPAIDADIVTVACVASPTAMPTTNDPPPSHTTITVSSLVTGLPERFVTHVRNRSSYPIYPSVGRTAKSMAIDPARPPFRIALQRVIFLRKLSVTTRQTLALATMKTSEISTLCCRIESRSRQLR